jgi:sphingolipid delta-4 desaturase
MDHQNTKVTDFCYSPSQEPHRLRTKTIIQKHPEIRQLIGRNPYSFLYIVLIVLLQIILAFRLRDQSWWLILLVAYLAGAFANHALFVLIHEGTHNLIFEKRAWNTLASILANLPLVVPTSVAFQRYHLKHHAFQGVYELDADIPNRWEARLVGSSALGKGLWLLLFPIFQATRPARLKEIKLVDGWSMLNLAVQLGFNVAVYILLGPKALLYLLFSLFFSIGLHPLGARWIQRHYLVAGEQETYSYYGLLNKLAFNVGYHNEHHDFPSVPWNNLPKIKQAAAEAYDPLASHRSWTRLLLQFLFDRKLSLFSRMVRAERGQVAFTAEVQPDVDLMKDARA